VKRHRLSARSIVLVISSVGEAQIEESEKRGRALCARFWLSACHKSEVGDTSRPSLTGLKNDNFYSSKKGCFCHVGGTGFGRVVGLLSC